MGEKNVSSSKGLLHGYIEAKIVYKMNTALRDVSTQKLVNYARDENGNIKKDEDGYRTIITNVSLEYKNEDGYSVGDVCKSKFDIHKEAFGEEYSDEYYKTSPEDYNIDYNGANI